MGSGSSYSEVVVLRIMCSVLYGPKVNLVTSSAPTQKAHCADHNDM